MRHPVAFALLLAAGCSDPSPSADAGTCGAPPAGMRYQSPGCTLVCVNDAGVYQYPACIGDGGAASCPDPANADDPNNCGACGRTCTCPVTTPPRYPHCDPSRLCRCTSTP